MKGFAYLMTALCVAFCAVSVDASAQTDRHEVRKGNREFKKGDYKNAEIDYRKALVKDSTSFAAQYNLGNTLYKSGDFAQASASYAKVKDAAGDSEYASSWHYNVGNAAASQKNWQEAVDAYKEALLRDPGDMDAKENYIYARKMLQDSQDNQNQDQNDDKNNQDNDQDNNRNQDQNNDQDGQDNQNNDNQGNQDNQGQQPKITPQAAQQLLQAIQAKEKETQEKVNKEKAEALKSRQREKNW
ncbi:MAG: tetratricopeptide repeat protein [Candidatus Cryptobacteroides sp.]